MEARPELRVLMQQLAAAAKDAILPKYPDRVASRLGDKTEFVPLATVSHFFANDKLTYAATASKQYGVDYTIQELEQRLDPEAFVRIIDPLSLICSLCTSYTPGSQDV